MRIDFIVIKVIPVNPHACTSTTDSTRQSDGETTVTVLVIEPLGIFAPI